MNGLASTQFPISRGTRQGCPLSPLIFAMALEPLAEALRFDLEFTGVTTGDKQFKLSMFADNMVLYVSNTSKSLPAIKRTLEEFSLVSGLKVNRDKSIVYPLHMSEDDRLELKEASPYSWVSGYLRYLGVKVPAQFSALGSTNLTDLNVSLQGLLRSWTMLI